MAPGAQSTAVVAERGSEERRRAGAEAEQRRDGGAEASPAGGRGRRANAAGAAAGETAPIAGGPARDAGPDRLTGRGLRPPAASPWARAGLLTLGGVLIAIGIAGLVLPGIQGILTIVAGLVVVSLGSHTVHRWTRRGLRRWPPALDTYERMRRKLRRRLRRRRRSS